MTDPGPKDPDMAALLQAVRACRLCQDLPLGPRPVLQAAATSKILIVGQAPGRKAHEAGRPFDDPSGDRLRRWLGLDRAAFYDPDILALVPMGFCFPGTGSGGDLAPRAECAPTWRPALLAQMKSVKLTIVLGAYAQAWHLGPQRQPSLTQTVAAWADYWPKLLPLPHPSPRNLRWFKQNPWFEETVIPTLQARVAQILA